MEARFVDDFIRMADDAWKMGWHECNGGNLSYLIPEGELEGIASSLREEDGASAFVPLSDGVCVSDLAGKSFLITAAGSHFRNIASHPEECIGIIRIDDEGRRFTILWGFEGNGRPTSELPSHLMIHTERMRSIGEPHSVVYHAHPSNVIALTSVLPHDADLVTRELWGTISECSLVIPRGVGMLDWMSPGSVALGRATCDALRSRDAVIWPHHGVLCAGSSLDAAFGAIHTIEKASEILVKVRSMQAEPSSRMTDDDLLAMSEAFGLGLRL